MPTTAEIASRIDDWAALGRADLPFADVYLARAEQLLASVYPRTHHEALLLDRRRRRSLGLKLRAGARRGDWDTVRKLAEEGEAIEERLVREQGWMRRGAALYGSWRLAPGHASLALLGGDDASTRAVRGELEEAARRMESLARAESAVAPFLTHRARALRALATVVSVEFAPSAADAVLVRERVLRAAERQDYGEVRRLAEAAGHPPPPRPQEPRVASHVDAPDEPFAEAVVRRVAALGLRAHRLAAAPREALGGGFAEIAERPLMTSLGRAYAPGLGPEHVLVEDVAEGSDERGLLLDALGLERRRGLSRLALEDALLRRGSEVCAALGFDPLQHVVACVPFDVWARLAPERRWGRAHVWTHFDGYRVTAKGRLLALVGGDERYGGLDDVCVVTRSYDAPRLFLRLAVVRRFR